MSVTSNAQMVIKRLDARWKKMDDGLGSVVANSAEFAKEFMQSIAPYETGATFRAIKWTKGRATNGKTATVIIGDGHPNRRGLIKGNGGQGGLTWFMNYGHEVDVWTSGEPRFIEKGVAETRKRFGRNVRRVVNAFVKGDK